MSAARPSPAPPAPPGRPAEPAQPRPAQPRPAQPKPAQPRPAAGPRLQVDWTLCEARGHCVEMLPELLAEDPWGYPIPRRDSLARGVAVPPHLAQHARDAVVSCPRLALILREH
jgi:ferredoxin